MRNSINAKTVQVFDRHNPKRTGHIIGVDGDDFIVQWDHDGRKTSEEPRHLTTKPIKRQLGGEWDK